MNEKLSALLDGDLEEESSQSVLDALGRDPGARRDWEAYCLIGDVLRGERAVRPSFVDRVMDEVRDEPTVIAPAQVRVQRERRTASRSFAQRLMPVAASVMGIAAVGLVAYTMYSGGEQAPVVTAVASQSGAVEPAAQRDVLALQSADDPHRKFVFVHQAMSGGGPMPTAFQYVRSVSDVRGDDRP